MLGIGVAHRTPSGSARNIVSDVLACFDCNIAKTEGKGLQDRRNGKYEQRRHSRELRQLLLKIVFAKSIDREIESQGPMSLQL